MGPGTAAGRGASNTASAGGNGSSAPGGGGGSGTPAGAATGAQAAPPQTLAQQLGLEEHQLDVLLAGFALAVARGPTPVQPSALPPLVLVRDAGVAHPQQLEDGTNSGGGSGNGKAARLIPSGRDDDIIARRLRRAAQEETDPVLREKLWKEYLSYRQNAHTP
ncbi:MAG TPA: hypothetical protein VME21_17060 [Steroidobacteraceae bacterium]|nr:hypothetical protein [Steroidobacteraceae bacterium]